MKPQPLQGQIETFFYRLICVGSLWSWEQKLRLFQLRPQMDGKTIQQQECHIWHGLLMEIAHSKSNEIFLRQPSLSNEWWLTQRTHHGFQWWFNVDLIVIGLNLKNAISQLLIKLETCGFQYLHQKNELFMAMMKCIPSELMAKSPH